jgi:hypothetical protein
MNKVPLILGIVFLAVVVLSVYVIGSARRVSRRGSSSGNHFGWALLFLASGRMPPPPPETQIEAEANTEKDRSASDPLTKPENIRRAERHLL